MNTRYGLKSLLYGAAIGATMLAPDLATAQTQVGSFLGVPAYANGSGGTGQSNYYAGFYTGVKWQCVEYVRRFYLAAYGRYLGTRGNANTWFNNGQGLNRRYNGGTTRPNVGDVLCSAYSSGHVAIVREVGANYIVVIHQNWANTSADNAKRLTMTVSGGRYTVAKAGSYSWQGWLSRF